MYECLIKFYVRISCFLCGNFFVSNDNGKGPTSYDGYDKIPVTCHSFLINRFLIVQMTIAKIFKQVFKHLTKTYKYNQYRTKLGEKFIATAFQCQRRGSIPESIKSPQVISLASKHN